MGYQAVKEYLLKLHARYRESDRAEKGRLLKEAEYFTGKSRKHLIRVLSGSREAIERKNGGGRPVVYGDELTPHLRELWVMMERISGKRMKAALPDWLRHYRAEGFGVNEKRLLLSMSAPTIERFLKALRGQEKAVKGLSATRSPSRHMKTKVPLNTLDHKVDRPGYAQADTVAHCGTNLEGTFANTLTVTDISSGWTDNRAMLSKKSREVREKFVEIKRMLPFTLLGVNVDNGTEFLNGPVIDFMNSPAAGEVGVHFTRSRAYKKNDNCYVEQKNFTHVRELFGYDRVTEAELVALMNDIYVNTWNPLQNFFLPNFKIEKKLRVGARVVKKYKTPKTAYQRLIESDHVTDEQKQALRLKKAALNPVELAQDLERKLARYFEILRRTQPRKVA